MERELWAELDRHGIVRLPDLLTDDQLRGMQRAFEVRLRRMRWNTSDGYEKTEPYRHMVQDVLTLDQGFVDLALHPLVKAILAGYLGNRYQLVEAKGWRSLPTRKDFHGWHGDAWYDQTAVSDIPREIKLALYLTDVKTGAFNYILGSHRKQHPRIFHTPEMEDIPPSQIVEITGSAGSAFLFDTSGIHRQGAPILEPRRAVFLNYHDPAVPLEAEDREYYRYHPLLLNAALLGKLSEEDQRILGFGDTRNYVPTFERRSGHDGLEALFRALFATKLRADIFLGRLLARIKRIRLI